MKNTKCLIVTCGFFGDIAFAGSLAKKLQARYDQIDYLIGFPQMYRLMSNNPFINKVYVSDFPNPHPVSALDYNLYDKVIQLQSLNYVVTPCEEYQITAGIETPSSEYTVYTQPEYDKVAQTLIDDLREQYGKPVVALMSNWEPKTYLFTEEQYMQGIDVPNLGYGGRHRNINFIVSQLQEYFTFYIVGVGNLNQHQTSNIAEDDTKSLLFEASVLKYCDAFLGTEGGLCNLAAGVGTKTIITGDFVHQLYGWNGVLKKIQQPKLGPEYYFPKVGHITINPYYNDKQVTDKIIQSLI